MFNQNNNKPSDDQKNELKSNYDILPEFRQQKDQKLFEEKNSTKMDKFKDTHVLSNLNF